MTAFIHSSNHPLSDAHRKCFMLREMAGNWIVTEIQRDDLNFIIRSNEKMLQVQRELQRLLSAR